MKIFFVIILSLITFNGIAQTIDSVENYVILCYSKLHRVPLETTPKKATIFVPEIEEISIVDSIIRGKLISDTLNLKEYLLQLMFVCDSNCNKKVFINGEVLGAKDGWTPEDLKTDWTKPNPDGGTSYFSCEIDLREKKIIEFTYMGEGG